MAHRSDQSKPFIHDSTRTHHNSGYPLMNNPNTNTSYSTNSFASQVEPWEQQITRTLAKILDGQNKIISRIDKMEGEIEVMQKAYPQKQLSKMSVELQKIAHRTGCIKDLATNAAAHTLNTSRKIHGAQSVLDPVKKFRKDGYKDWSIRPETAETAHLFEQPVEQMMAPRSATGLSENSFGQYRNSAHGLFKNVYPQRMSRAPAFAPRSPVDPDDDETTAQGIRTPTFGSRTPEYEEPKEKSSVVKFGNARFEPYQNRKARNVSFGNPPAANPAASPYVPTSPTFN